MDTRSACSCDVSPRLLVAASPRGQTGRRGQHRHRRGHSREPHQPAPLRTVRRVHVREHQVRPARGAAAQPRVRGDGECHRASPRLGTASRRSQRRRDPLRVGRRRGLPGAVRAGDAGAASLAAHRRVGTRRPGSRLPPGARAGAGRDRIPRLAVAPQPGLRRAPDRGPGAGPHRRRRLRDGRRRRDRSRRSVAAVPLRAAAVAGRSAGEAGDHCSPAAVASGSTRCR